MLIFGLFGYCFGFVVFTFKHLGQKGAHFFSLFFKLLFINPQLRQSNLQREII